MDKRGITREKVPPKNVHEFFRKTLNIPNYLKVRIAILEVAFPSFNTLHTLNPPPPKFLSRD